MTQPIENNLENDNRSSDQKQAATDRSPLEIKQALVIISSVNEVSRHSFIEKFGQELLSIDPVLANAGRIAEVDLNSALFNPDQLTGLEILDLELFDGIFKQILITKHVPSAAIISLQGRLEESPSAVFFLSVTGQQALATLRLPDINTVCTVKHIHPAGRHYLFQGLITEVEQYACDIKIPPAPGSIN